jgi:hypothetical protein
MCNAKYFLVSNMEVLPPWFQHMTVLKIIVKIVSVFFPAVCNPGSYT